MWLISNSPLEFLCFMWGLLNKQATCDVVNFQLPTWVLSGLCGVLHDNGSIWACGQYVQLTHLSFGGSCRLELLRSTG